MPKIKNAKPSEEQTENSNKNKEDDEKATMFLIDIDKRSVPYGYS